MVNVMYSQTEHFMLNYILRIQMIISDKDKNEYNMALHNFMLDTNNRYGMQAGGSVFLANKVIKIIKDDELIDTFASDVTIQDNIGAGLFCLVIENQKAIQAHAGKMFFWPSKYKIDYNYGILSIEDENIKILVV